MKPKSSQNFDIIIDKNNVPLNVQAFSMWGEMIGELKISPDLVDPGNLLDKGKSDYVSSKKPYLVLKE